MKTTTSTIKQTALRLLAGLIFFLLLAPMAAGEEASTPPTYWEDQISNVDKIVNDNGGDGTSWEQAIRIASAEELAYFAKQVNEGKDIKYGSGSGTAQIKPGGNDSQINGFFDYYFALSADINLEKHYWTPIGTNDNPFKGYFDGKGHCVSGLKVNVKENSGLADVYAGLFGNANSSTLQNLGVRLAEEGVRASAEKGSVYAGGIAGLAKNIYCCYVEGLGSVEAVSDQATGSQSSLSYAGGIAGNLSDFPFLTHCYATVAVKATAITESYAGGIVGRISSFAKISNTYATGTVEATSQGTKNYAGGIVGYVRQDSDFKHNLALNDSVKAKKSNRMVGYNESNVTFSSNYASPDMLVSDTVVSGGTDGDANGDPDVNLDNFGKVFSGDDGWDTSDKARLPKLRMRTGDGLDYEDWPNGNQLTLPAYDYLIAGKIANTGGGNGSEGKPILIANRVELAYLAKQVNAGKDLAVSNNVASGSIKNDGDHEGFKGICFALSADIDLKEHYWTPIGTEGNPFNGNFDGKGYCVSGLKVDGTVEYAGLFGYAKDGTLRNIGVHLAKEGVYGINVAGGIAGLAANINNCYVVGEGMIKAGPNNIISLAGGIAGNIFGSLSNCYATIDVEGEGGTQNHVGGIVGYGESTSSVSYTYSTGNVFVKGGFINYAGGICGITYGELYSNLAANGKIKGDDSNSHRIVGKKINEGAFNSNYASATIQVNGAPVTGGDADSWNGTPSYLSTFVDDLINAGWSREKGWEDFSSGTNFPQLMMLNSQQPLKVSDYLPPCPKLHIIPTTGGSLTVTDKDGNKLSDGSDIRSGTLLKLAYTEDANYGFSGYLSGSDKSSLKSYGSNSITMTDDDLYLSATFTVYPKLHIVSSTGGTLKVTDNDGNELSNGNYILPGTLLKLAYIEADNYYFSEYLSGSNEGSLSIYGDNSITMPDDDLYLSATFTLYPKLHIVSPTGGTLKVTGNDGKELSDGNYIRPGTLLTLVYTEADNYHFSGYLFGSDESSLSSYGDNSITMPDADLYLSVTFTLYPKLHIVSPTGGTLKVTGNDGKELSDGNYIRPGTVLTLVYTEADNYRFSGYLSGSNEGSLSIYGDNSITMPNDDLYLSATFTYQEPTPPYVPPTPVFYSVYLPQVEGATTDPAPGEYKVESWDNFRFTLKIDSAYNESQPVVTTSRGETLQPRSIDGSYLVKYVRSDVEVFIDGIFKNTPPVANEAISADVLAPQIWAEGSMLCIRMAEALPSAPVRIFTPDGRLHASFASTPGLIRRQLSTGIYIVRVGETVCKVLIR